MSMTLVYKTFNLGTSLINTEDNIVECCTHGSRYPVYVCRHLNLHTPVGFYEPFASDLVWLTWISRPYDPALDYQTVWGPHLGWTL